MSHYLNEVAKAAKAGAGKVGMKQTKEKARIRSGDTFRRGDVTSRRDNGGTPSDGLQSEPEASVQLRAARLTQLHSRHSCRISVAEIARCLSADRCTEGRSRLVVAHNLKARMT